VVRSFAIDQSEELISHEVPTAGTFPELAGQKGREMELLATDGVHLPPNDPPDPGSHALAERQHRVMTG
jgi:hypothetical protein